MFWVSKWVLIICVFVVVCGISEVGGGVGLVVGEVVVLFGVGVDIVIFFSFGIDVNWVNKMNMLLYLLWIMFFL